MYYLIHHSLRFLFVHADENIESKGIWVWNSTLYEVGIENFSKEMEEHNFSEANAYYYGQDYKEMCQYLDFLDFLLAMTYTHNYKMPLSWLER